jgi:hypothetical protein
MKPECFLESEWFMNTVNLLRTDGLENFCGLHIVFEESMIVRTKLNCRRVQKMEEAWNDFSTENEAKGMNVHLGVEGSNSNGHGEEIYKEGNMMKIIEILHKYVQHHRADNKNVLKTREQQGEFNIKLIQSLERIEKKLYKGSDSSKSGSHKLPDDKRKSRSVGRQHNHSQGHSKRRVHSSSSPSPTRKHRRSGVDELKGEMNKIKPPTFDGEHQKEEYVETWLLGMRKYFQL